MAGRFSNFNDAGNPSVRKTTGIQFVKSMETSDKHQISGISSPGESYSDTSHSIGSLTNLDSNSKSIPSLMSCQVTPQKGFDTSAGNSSVSSPYGHMFVKAGEGYSSLNTGSSGRGSTQGYKMPGRSNLNREKPRTSSAPSNTGVPFQSIPQAKSICSNDEYLQAWKQEKDSDLQKFRKLAYEVVSLKSHRPNAKDKLHSAANRVPVRIDFNTQPVFGAHNKNSFLCYVTVENVNIASGQGPKIKDAKTNAYEAALQKILMPHIRIIPGSQNSKELQASKETFTSPPPAPSIVPLSNNCGSSQKDASKEVTPQHKESNMEAAGLKRRHNEYKPLDEFVIVEPKVPIPDCTAAHTLRRSADFNHMLLEYEYFFKGEAARCILRIENEILAEVSGISKAAAKNAASAQALIKLKTFCWVIKTKQAVDSNTKISKDEMLTELNDQSDGIISQDNIGNKLLRKMGWVGGGVGKDGSGIAEPVTLKSALNREGLGLSATKGVTDEFRKKIKELVENYAASGNQEDLVFACDFTLDERQIIHTECRKLNLRSKSKGKGQKRYLCVQRKRSVNQLFNHLMSVGGETIRYQLVPPPGQDDIYSPMTNNPSGVHGSQSHPNMSMPMPLYATSQQITPNMNQQGSNFLQNSPSRPANTNVSMQSAIRQGGPLLHQGLHPVNFSNANGSRDRSMGDGSNFPGNHGPRHNFSDNFVNRGHNVQSHGADYCPSTFGRAPMNNAGGRPSTMNFNPQNNTRMDSLLTSRPNAFENVKSSMNNFGFNHQPSNDGTLYSAGNSSPNSRTLGDFAQRESNGYQQQQRSVPPNRTGFNDNYSGGPRTGRESSFHPSGLAHSMSSPNQGWNGPRGPTNNMPSWGMSTNRPRTDAPYTNQSMAQYQNQYKPQ